MTNMHMRTHFPQASFLVKKEILSPQEPSGSACQIVSSQKASPVLSLPDWHFQAPLTPSPNAIPVLKFSTSQSFLHSNLTSPHPSSMCNELSISQPSSSQAVSGRESAQLIFPKKEISNLETGGIDLPPPGPRSTQVTQLTSCEKKREKNRIAQRKHRERQRSTVVSMQLELEALEADSRQMLNKLRTLSQANQALTFKLRQYEEAYGPLRSLHM